MANNIALTPIREEQQHVAPTLSTPFPQLQINSPCADLLHASAKNTHFVKNLVKHMKKEDMELQNKNSNTALSLAAAAGAVTIAKIIVETDIQEKDQKESQNQTKPSTEWKGQSQRSTK
ncbi:ankyrin repeat-containing protein ITN1-like protein isoform X1 [Tanacetum coccineum]|uniref:Ankyrin repeat-containing protein ITN1-like protein isoform X1 n=1 Tax=Tanacetum coccineum TaxID=301880 RepID=A0ABQ5HCN5_9ASTR